MGSWQHLPAERREALAEGGGIVEKEPRVEPKTSTEDEVEGPSVAAVSAAAAAAAAAGSKPPTLAMAGRIFGKRRTVFSSIPIGEIQTNPKQPRQHFEEKALEDLAESIRKRGVLQPVIVRPEPAGGYTLIAGERRLRASQRAGVAQIPAMMSEDDLLEVALEENVQREDLSPLEEAEALSLLASERSLSHGDLARVINKSRPYVSNTLALTRLPDDIKQEYFSLEAPASREIMISIARQESEEAMRVLWKRVKLDAISVRSFRNEQRAANPEESSRPVLRAVRRLGRAIRGFPDPQSLPPAEVAPLRRSLIRMRNRIEKVLEKLPEEPKPAPLVKKAAAGSAENSAQSEPAGT
jgi:ParB/RepB/Spo0J family partition protein